MTHRFTDRFVDLVEEGVDVAVPIGAPKEDSQLLTRTVAWQQCVTSLWPPSHDTGVIGERGDREPGAGLPNASAARQAPAHIMRHIIEPRRGCMPRRYQRVDERFILRRDLHRQCTAIGVPLRFGTWPDNRRAY